MPTRTRFTEGLTRLRGAPIEAPYDLTNAHLRDVSGVEAVLVPKEPPSDTPTAPQRYQTPIRQSSQWIDAQGDARRGEALYITTPPGTGDGLTTYRGLALSADTRIPQITNITTRLGGQDQVIDPFSEDKWPRYIYYLLVPINEGGEAGPLAFAGARINTEKPLPSMTIQGNRHVRWIEVYRTPAIYEKQNEVTPGAQAFYEAARIGVGGGGVSTDATRELGVDIPEHDQIVRDDVDLFNYYNATGTNKLYVSATTRIEATARITDSDLPNSAVGWRVRFYDIPDLASSGLLEDTLYDITGTGTDGNGDFYFELGTTFDVKPLIESQRYKKIFWRLVRGATIEFVPPTGDPLDTAVPTAIYSDDKNWYMDVGSDQQEDYTPTGAPFDRPFNVFAPSGVSATSGGATPSFSQSTPVLRPRARDLHFNGGNLYAASPEWPTKIPNPTYLETASDTSGFDVRLQHEYSLPNGEVLGPPLELSNVTKLAIGWQGAEQAVNVFVKGGEPGYEIVGSNIAQVDQVQLHDDPPLWFQNEISAGDEIIIRHNGTPRTFEIRGQSTGDLDTQTDGIDVEILLPETQYAAVGDQAVARRETHLAENTDEYTADQELRVYDPTGRFVDWGGGSAFVTPLSDTATTVKYNVKSSSHSGNVTTLTTYDKVGSHAPGSNVELRLTTNIDSASATGLTRVDVVDPDNDLGSLASGTGIDIVAGPNEGSYTLSDAAQANTPTEGRTRLPLGSLVEESDKGEVRHDAAASSWQLYRRVTVSPYGGLFTRSGSTFVFSSQAFAEGDTQGRSSNLESYADSIEENDAVFFSNVNRPLEVTFDQFKVPEGQTIRAIFRARLAEEEGLRAYRFYVGTESAIYAVRPIPQDREAELHAVTTAFGIGTGPQEQPVHAFIPGGVIVKGTSGLLYALTGRRTQRLFQDGQAPWRDVRSLAYDEHEEVLFIATDTGIWGYDRQRQAIVSNHDINSDLIVWDEIREVVLAHDKDVQTSATWRALHWNGWFIESIDTANGIVTVQDDKTNDFAAGDLIEVGDLGTFEVNTVSLSSGNTDLDLVESISSTDARYVRKYHAGEVETQPITPGGDEVGLGEVKTDYDRLDYDPKTQGTYATLQQTRRHSDDQRSVDMPRGYPVYPPLRGEGLQVRVNGIQVLSEVQIENVEPAD